LDEKIRDFGRTLESRSAHEESLKAKITGLQSSLDAKQKVIQDEKAAAIKETDTWSKRVQKGHDKVAQLTRDIQKITSDCDDFRSQNDRLLTEISQIKQDTEAKNSEFATMKKERDESIAKARSLRSNEQMVKDQIKKAVREAEDAKEEEITRLLAQVARLEQGKKADEENIRELSRLRHRALQ
jgi:chromosome segregation ATPase